MITKFETQSGVDALPLHGVTYTPDTPTCVLNIVHGFGEHSGRYGHMMDHLGQHGIACAAIDLRGHGQSGGKRGACRKYEHFHSDVDALLAKSAETFPGLPQVLFGHSMGGGLVLHYTLKNGPSGHNAVIASAPLLTLTTPIAKPLQLLMRLLRMVAPDLAVKNEINGAQISTLPEERAAYENDPLNHACLSVGLGPNMMDAGTWALKNAETMPLPSLLLHSKDDKLTGFDGSEQFTAKAPNSTLRPFENVEHEMHNDVSRPDIYASIIAFIRQHT